MVLPYLKGLVIIKRFCIFFFYIYCISFVFRYLVLNKWYQRTFQGRSCGQLFFIFADFFFQRRKKRAATFQTFSIYLCAKFYKMVVYMSSSQKNTQFKKKNRPKHSPEGQDIEVLKSAIFQGFFLRTAARFIFIFVAFGS
jgi:hypothetical protein